MNNLHIEAVRLVQDYVAKRQAELDRLAQEAIDIALKNFRAAVQDIVDEDPVVKLLAQYIAENSTMGSNPWVKVSENARNVLRAAGVADMLPKICANKEVVGYHIGQIAFSKDFNQFRFIPASVGIPEALIAWNRAEEYRRLNADCSYAQPIEPPKQPEPEPKRRSFTPAQCEAVKDLLWDYLKKDLDHKGWKHTGWGTKTLAGLTSCIERIAYDSEKGLPSITV